MLTSPAPLSPPHGRNDILPITQVRITIAIPECLDVKFQVNEGRCVWKPGAKTLRWDLETVKWDTRPILTSRIEYPEK